MCVMCVYMRYIPPEFCCPVFTGAEVSGGGVLLFPLGGCALGACPPVSDPGFTEALSGTPLLLVLVLTGGGAVSGGVLTMTGGLSDG